MAHKIGLNDTQYEPDICGTVDFSFFDDDNDVERTKGEKSEIVKRNSVLVSSSSSHRHRRHTVIESSLPSSLGSIDATKCLVESRFLEDTSCGLTKEEEKEGEKEGGCWRNPRSRRRRQREGHQETEARRDEDRASFGSSSGERVTGGSTSSLEAHQQNLQASGAVMEHVDPRSPYSSDEWEEESELSDTDGDHSDSSDDDDPKSQVDRLIERGTLMYMDGENSNLSSETESSDSSDYDNDSDSESDITDVSPLISATASPLGLSPVLPRRTLGTSPLALHDNRDLGVLDYRPEISSNDQGYDSQPHCNGSSHSNSDDSTDMTLLLKAVVELEKKQKRQNNHHHTNRSNDHYNNRHHHYPHHHKNHQNSRHHQNNHHQSNQSSSPVPIHPIDASPHHSHLRRASHSHRRKNMSFSNDEVRRLDRENQILLQKIMSVHSRNNSQSSSNQNNRSVHRPANSTVNRRREEERIRRENMILLRKIQEARPSRDITASRPTRHRTTHSVRPPSSLPATPGSIGASARTA